MRADVIFLISFIRLAVITALVAVCAEFLVSAINDVCEQWHVSQTFVGLVLLPIVGNAAEHVTAVTVAIKNKVNPLFCFELSVLNIRFNHIYPDGSSPRCRSWFFHANRTSRNPSYGHYWMDHQPAHELILQSI